MDELFSAAWATGSSAITTRPHILQECPIYDQHRRILRKVSEDVALAEILGMSKGIDALTRFLKKRGAFKKTGHPRAEPHAPRWEDEPDPVGEDGRIEDEGWETGEAEEEREE
ncbi:hypothetical protein K523DRAFT_398423 [Schizophyllum commune Tattone D]|nr:hypothetical protein K523DRAFT_398423 [Schizophyllum commune Tattone D]